MDTEKLVSLTDQLDDDIDDLEAALRPLITGALSDTAQRLPLLDRAKLYALTTYAIESILFSFIRLNGTNAKEHPVFHELTRVKQYFEKIRAVEFGEPKRENMSLDKPAVRRFLKHDLAGNVQLDKVKGQLEIKIDTLSQTNPVPSSPKRKFEEIEEHSSAQEETSNSDLDFKHTKFMDCQNTISSGKDVHGVKVSTHLAVGIQINDSIPIVGDTGSVVKGHSQALSGSKKGKSAKKSRKKRSAPQMDH